MENQELARAAYEAHLPAAKALPAERVLEFRVDPAVAIINVNHAMKLVAERKAEIMQHLPRISMSELEGLPGLAMAVTWSAIRVQNAIGDGIAASDMVAEGWQIRATLMPVVAGLARVGAIPQEVHDNIVRGRGARDMAADCVALSHVFRDYQAQVAGKHGVPAHLIARAEEVGSWLLARLRKRSAHRAPDNDTPEIDIRDRMATLLVERYSKLRAVAYYFYFEDYAEYAPPLNSRRASTKREASEPAPE